MTTTYEPRLDYGTLRCDVPTEIIDGNVVIDIPDFAGQSEPIAAGRYSFPVSTLESATLAEVWTPDSEHDGLNVNGVKLGTSHGNRGKIGTGEWVPAVIFGRFCDSKHYGPGAQLSRIEWVNGRYTYVDCRVIELTRVEA